MQSLLPRTTFATHANQLRSDGRTNQASDSCQASDSPKSSANSAPSATPAALNAPPSTPTALDRITTFSFSKPGVKPPVFVAGSMTEPPWSPQEMSHGWNPSADDSTTAALHFTKDFKNLAEGTHQYKFRIGHDDEWVLDHHAETDSDAAGNRNNVVVVPKLTEASAVIAEAESMLNKFAETKASAVPQAATAATKSGDDKHPAEPSSLASPAEVKSLAPDVMLAKAECVLEQAAAGDSKPHAAAAETAIKKADDTPVTDARSLRRNSTAPPSLQSGSQAPEQAASIASVATVHPEVASSPDVDQPIDGAKQGPRCGVDWPAGPGQIGESGIVNDATARMQGKKGQKAEDLATATGKTVAELIGQADKAQTGHTDGAIQSSATSGHESAVQADVGTPKAEPVVCDDAELEARRANERGADVHKASLAAQGVADKASGVEAEQEMMARSRRVGAASEDVAGQARADEAASIGGQATVQTIPADTSESVQHGTDEKDGGQVVADIDTLAGAPKKDTNSDGGRDQHEPSRVGTGTGGGTGLIRMFVQDTIDGIRQTVAATLERQYMELADQSLLMASWWSMFVVSGLLLGYGSTWVVGWLASD